MPTLPRRAPVPSRSGTAAAIGTTSGSPAADSPRTMPKPVHQEMPMRQSHQGKEAGFSFAELAFAFLILVIGAVVLGNHLAVNYRTTATERDRVFAYSKAQAILSEIQGFVDRGQVDAAVDLDVLDDGIVNRPVLSIQTDQFGALVTPGHVVSGNYQRGAEWQWSRRITVQPFQGINNRNVRYVTVRIFKKDANGVDHPMADLSAVINSAGSAFPTTQVFDIYLLAIENIPGWWVFMDSIRPFVESMVTDLENRNPGLTFRTHWITKASFGRNEAYRPYTNDDTDSYAVIPHVYHYPGRMPNGNASSYYYVPDNMRARINADGVERNGYHADLNPRPYALADYFNHGMRYPDELALWTARTERARDRRIEIASRKLAGLPPPPELTDMSEEPTMRLLLEDLYSTPDKYRNALVINLHGELLPMPALRNYSDAAKSPVDLPDIRVVTHPEELRTRRDDGGVTDSLQLRVYAYNAHTPTYNALVGLGTRPAVMPDPMVIEVMGVNLTDGTSRLSGDCTLLNVPGGVLVNGSTAYPSTWQTAKHSDDAPFTDEMHYSAIYVTPSIGEPFTRIFLHNTPVVCPPVAQLVGMTTQQFGLQNTERAQLYQMPYVPCPTSAGPSYAMDLTQPGIGPKNTARWTLRIAPAVLSNGSFAAGNPVGDVMMRIRTRIATGYTTGTSTWGSGAWENSGTMWPTPNDPDNLSVTYAWWADSMEDVPITERSQFMGDPRHLPYRDCFNGGNDYPNSFNWYLDNINNGGEPAINDFPSISATAAASPLRNRWGSAMNCDVPRYFELLRKALVRSACVYTTLTGWSYYYMGVGNDIGYDSANGYANSIPSNMVPHGGTGNGFIDTITGARRLVRTAGAGYWWGIPWLGELYPDGVAQSEWLNTTAGAPPRGNLTAGTAAGRFYQSTANSVYSGSGRTAFGTSLNNHIQRTNTFGCTTFFNIGTTASTFQHTGTGGNGTLTAVGNELALNYNMTMPTAAPITRPFRLTNASGGVAEHWNLAPYSTERFTASLYRTYYTQVGGIGSGLVKLVDNTNSNAAYIVVNGISNAVDNGTTFISKFAVLSLVHSFFEAGNTGNTLRIPQLARVEIESPTDITELDDPSAIAVQYGIDWRRWDGLPYAQTGTFAEDESLLQYVLMYSNDNGGNWYHMQDDTVARPGTVPSDSSYLVDDAGAGVEVFSWDVPTVRFPEGSYQIRIDCFRQGAQVHYSFHQTRIFIQR
jgi:hypothetical protein